MNPTVQTAIASDRIAPLLDGIVTVPENQTPRILWLTDMQIIDASGRRSPDRISAEKIAFWAPERVKANCYDHITELVSRVRPHLILITGDIVYGEFDDSGRMLENFIAFMDSLSIPWAPVFGNHDNESKIGIMRQCGLYEAGKHCLFRRGSTIGYGNYTVGLLRGDTLCRVLYLFDSHGCAGASEQAVKALHAGIYEEQMQYMEAKATALRSALGTLPPAFAAYHIQTTEFIRAAEAKGYQKSEADRYIIGVDVPAGDGDFGCKQETAYGAPSPERFTERLRAIGVTDVLAGHCHAINTSITHEGIRWTFGLKTGVYDYFTNGQLGGTLLRCEKERTEIAHVLTLVPYEPQL